MQGIESLDNFKKFVSSLGGLGRYEDTYIVHAAEGETVVPMEVLDRNPALKKRLFQSMMDMGIEPGRYIVGNELNSRNPVTGQPEFFLKQIGRRLRKAAADISGYAAPIVGALYGPGAGAATGALLGQYKRENPGDPTQGLNMALRGGLAGIGTNIAGGQTGLDTIFGRGLAEQNIGLTDLFKSGGLDTLKDFLNVGEGRKSFARQFVEDLFTGDKGKASDVISKFKDKTIGELEPDELKELFDGLSGSQKTNLIDALKAGVPLTLALGFLLDKTTDQGPVGMPIQELPEGQAYGYNPELTFGNPKVRDPFSTVPAMAEGGGVMDLRQGGESEGPGTGTSDDIPAMLSDGEFVMTAKAVRGAGGGDRREGAKRMYEAMDKLEAQA